MLEGLDDINWHSLSHAYGPADDVPETLWALASGKTSGEDASGVFWGNIWHQGTVYEATAYAVPFLIELLQDKRIKDREWLLLLLSNLATGNSYQAVHGNAPVNGLLLEVPEEFEAGRQREIGWVQRAHDEIRAGIPIYLNLLENRRPEVRTADAKLLSVFPESAREIVPQARQALTKEKNRDAHASLLLCLAVLGDPDSATRQVMETCLKRRRSDPNKLAAAIGLIWRGKENAMPEAVEVIQKTLAAPENFPESFVFSAWDIDADPGVALYETLLSLGQYRFASALTQLLGKVEDPAGPLIDFLIEYGFPEHKGKAVTATSLTSSQRNALAAMAATDALWNSAGEWETTSVGSKEWQYGLPTMRIELRRLLEAGDA